MSINDILPLMYSQLDSKCTSNVKHKGSWKQTLMNHVIKVARVNWNTVNVKRRYNY